MISGGFLQELNGNQKAFCLPNAKQLLVFLGPP